MKKEMLTRDGKPAEGPLSSRDLSDLTFFSTALFVSIALLVQFVLNFYTAWLLSVNAYSYRYSLFSLNYASASHWYEEAIYFIFGSGPVILTLLGFLLVMILRQSRIQNWKFRLTLTWLAFMMANALPCNIIAGVFFYEGFGIAFRWLLISYLARGVIGALVLAILVFFRFYWQQLFLKASYSVAFLSYFGQQKLFIKHAVFKPWMYGTVILLLFNWPYSDFLWRVFMLTLGFVGIPLIFAPDTFYRLKITRSAQGITGVRRQGWVVFAVIFLIWMADNFIMDL
ncbi:MAG: hypothetical protein ACOYNC_18320 [Bacteroidales bacterium]